MSNIKSLIFEETSLLENDLEEVANYPKGFDIKTFKSIPTFKGRVEYAKQHLSRLGAGSARLVMDADAETVLKIAKNTKGLAQNDFEIDVGRIDNGNITTLIRDYDEDSLWIEAEKAIPAKEKDFARLLGFEFGDFVISLIHWVTSERGKESSLYPPQNYEEISSSDFFHRTTNLIGNFDLAVGDLGRVSSWGIVTRDGAQELVLTDYGLGVKVYNDYYLH